MARFTKSKKHEIGLLPDTFVLRGEKKRDSVLLRVIDYDADNLKEYPIESIADAVSLDQTETSSWLNIDGLHDNTIMQEISDKLELDPAILSDVMNTYSRPKIHEYDNCIYVSLKMLRYDDEHDTTLSENLVLIIKENILISFQERQGDVFEPIRESLRKNKKRLRTSGTDYLAFMMIDIVIDNYNYIISRIGEKIENIDEELIIEPRPSLLEDTNKFKSEIIYLRKAIRPCRDLIQNAQKIDSDLLSDDVFVYMNELHDNIHQAYESLEIYREILTDQLNIYHTTVSSKLNDIMKFLTVFSVIFIPLTFIAGVYGTNFDNIPELHYKDSYFIMWGVMVLVAIGMIIYFKNKKWL